MKLWTLTPEAQAYRDRKVREATTDPTGGGSGKPLAQCSDYEVDMWCFNRHPWRNRYKWEFLVRAMQHQWPNTLLLQQTINGARVVNYWAIRIIKECCRSNLVNLMGCASSGKTHIAACFCYTVWKSAPHNTSAYLSTTTTESLDTKLWATVNQIFGEDKHQFGKMINSIRALVLEEEVTEDNAKNRDLRNAIKGVVIPTGNEGNNVVGTIAGRKNDRTIWCCDEYSHMDLGVMKGRMNLFANAAAGGWAQFISANNGPHEGSASMIDCEPENGWESVNKDDHWRWETSKGVCLYFNGDKSPNLRVERGQHPPFPKIADWLVRDEMLKAAGHEENTPEFWTQWFGFPPSINISDTVLTKAYLMNGGAFLPAEWEGASTKWVGGFDPGFKKGGDPCCAHFGKIGRDVRAKNILELEPDAVTLQPDATGKEAFEQQIAKKFVSACEKRGCREIAIDVTGDGGIMLQAIEKEARERGYQLNCMAVSFSGTADDKIVIPGEKRVGKDMFANKVSQLWSVARICVDNKVIRGLGDKGKAVQQLCQRKYFTDEKKRWQVEPKRSMKERIKRSPDQADACCLCIHIALKHGLSGGDVKPPPPKPPVHPGVPKEKSRYGGHATARHSYTGR